MLLVAVLFTFLIKSVSLECVIDNRSPSYEWQSKLFDYLKCNGNKQPNENTTIVNMKFILKNFFFDSTEEQFTIQSWMFFSWDDPRLKWNPGDFGDLDNIILTATSFWTPVGLLDHANDIDEWTTFSYLSSHCEVKSYGRATCIPRVTHTITCKSELQNWPYDVKNCSFQFYIKNKNTNNVIFTFNATRGLSTFGAEYGLGWDIIDYEFGENATGEVKMYLNFIVERHALGCAAMCIIPSIIIAILTITSMVLDAKILRFGLSIFGLICNFFLLKSIEEIIPHKGSDTPSILYFIHSSIYITTWVICSLLILSWLTHRKDSPHQWIINLNQRVLNSRVIKYFVFGKSIEPSLSSSDETNYIEKWNEFTIIMNSFMFYIIVISYLILYRLYIPQPKTDY